MKTIEEQTAVEAYNYASKNTDGNHSMTKSINDFISGAQWERNRDRWLTGMPEFDGQYLVAIEVEMGPDSVMVYQKIIGCFMNRWVVESEAENIIGYQFLPEPPKNKEL